MTNEELLAWAATKRKVAAKIGSMYGLWDLIFDAEALAMNKQTLLERSIIEKMIREEK